MSFFKDTKYSLPWQGYQICTGKGPSLGSGKSWLPGPTEKLPKSHACSLIATKWAFQEPPSYLANHYSQPNNMHQKWECYVLITKQRRKSLHTAIESLIRRWICVFGRRLGLEGVPIIEKRQWIENAGWQVSEICGAYKVITYLRR